MKRFLAALLAALTVFTLTGCGETENPAEPVTPGQAEEPATPTEPEPTPEEIAEQERLAAEKAREERLQGLLNSMTLEEKVGQLFFVRCPETNAVEDISTYHLGGYLLFSRDYKDGDVWLTRDQFTQKLQSYQDAASIPLFIGSDEEGGTVTRASRNPNLFDTLFRSPKKIAAQAGDAGDAWAEEAWEKNSALLALGIKRIYLGPTLPAFLSETVVKTLVDTYQLQPITHPQQDLDAILHRG